MARKKKHEEHEEHANHERWVLSYADILTLLLALFIVMFAISKVDQKKFEEFSRGTAEGFGNVAIPGQQGNFDGGDGIMKDQKPAQSEDVPATTPDDRNSVLAQQAISKERSRAAAAKAEKANLEEVKAKIQGELEKQGLAEAVQMSIDARGLIVNIVTDKVLFDTGQADLTAGGMKVLDAVAPALKSLPNYVSVEGHTDNVPISGRFPSNWELSTARATEVTRRLIVDGVKPDHVSATGFADTRPLGPNSTEAGKARNRRVAVVVLPYLPQEQADSGLAPADKSSGDPIAPVTPAAPTLAPSFEVPAP